MKFDRSTSPNLCDACKKPCEGGEYLLSVALAVRGHLSRHWRFCSRSCRALWWASEDAESFRSIHGPRDLPNCIHCGGDANGDQLYLCRTKGHIHVGDRCVYAGDHGYVVGFDHDHGRIVFEYEDGHERESVSIGDDALSDFTRDGAALRRVARTTGQTVEALECPHCDGDGKEAPTLYCSHDSKDAWAETNFDRDFEATIAIETLGKNDRQVTRSVFACPHTFDDWWRAPATIDDRMPDHPDDLASKEHDNG